MEKKLKGKKVAILVADGFEQVELTEPKKALEEAGAITEIVSPAENGQQLGDGRVDERTERDRNGDRRFSGFSRAACRPVAHGREWSREFEGRQRPFPGDV